MHLLGRHVGQRANDLAGAGEVRRGLGGRRGRFGQRLGVLWVGVADQLAETEVEDLGDAVVRQHDVVGFQVAVQHALAVRSRQPGGDAGGDVDRARDVQRIAADQVA